MASTTHVTYYTDKPDSLPTGSQLRVVARVYKTAIEATARANAVLADGGNVAPETAYTTHMVDDDVDVGWWLNISNGAVSETLPAGAFTDDQAAAAAWRLRLHNAWRAYVAGDPSTARQGWWPSVRTVGSNETAQDALIATDRWAYAQIALGAVIASGTLNSRTGLTTPTLREAAVAQIETAITTAGLTWYGVMVGDKAKRDQWKGGSVADGAAIYTDLFETNNFGIRTMDGTFGLVNPPVTIPTKFNPDRDSLIDP